MIKRLIVILFYFASVSADTSLSSKIPHTIWQTYKTRTLPSFAVDAHDSWINLNSEFSYFFFDDVDVENYIRQNWPVDFLSFFHALPIGAMKADLWRYLIIASEGGVYCDIDSVCIQPIRNWPLEGRASSHVILLDLDCDQSQFCQWTFAATANHPLMRYICHYVLNQWKANGLTLEPDGTVNVLATTGPIIFSQAIRSYLGEGLNKPAIKIYKKYLNDKEYRKKLNRLGIFFTNKGFFSGEGAKNLFWGSWANNR